MRNLWNYRPRRIKLDYGRRLILNGWHICFYPTNRGVGSYLSLTRLHGPMFVIVYRFGEFVFTINGTENYLSYRVSKKRIHQIIEYIIENPHLNDNMISKLAFQYGQSQKCAIL